MFDYTEVKRTHGRKVSQTLDEPIMIFEIWELTEAFFAMFVILILGVLFNQWLLTAFTVGLLLVLFPWVRANFNKGMVFHFPYAKFGMTLPELPTPKTNNRKVSD